MVTSNFQETEDHSYFHVESWDQFEYVLAVIERDREEIAASKSPLSVSPRWLFRGEPHSDNPLATTLERSLPVGAEASLERYDRAVMNSLHEIESVTDYRWKERTQGDFAEWLEKSTAAIQLSADAGI